MLIVLLIISFTANQNGAEWLWSSVIQKLLPGWQVLPGCCKSGPTVLGEWNPGLSLSPNGSKAGSRTASKTGCGELASMENTLAQAVFLSGRIFLGHFSFPKGLLEKCTPVTQQNVCSHVRFPRFVCLRLLFKFFPYRHQSVGWYRP